METVTVMSVIATAMAVGLGCGTCCSPTISTFLTSYIMSHSGSVKRGLSVFLTFFLGKIAGITALCLLASFLGRQFISPEGYIGSFNLRFAVQCAMAVIGVTMILRWRKEYRNSGDGSYADSSSSGDSHAGCSSSGCSSAHCGHCHGGGNSGENLASKGTALPLFAAGITYGITPCAPLIMMTGYCLSLPVSFAALTGISFGLASATSPLLLVCLVSGILSKQLMRELPQQLKWFRLASYLCLIVVPFVAGPGRL